MQITGGGCWWGWWAWGCWWWCCCLDSCSPLFPASGSKHFLCCPCRSPLSTPPSSLPASPEHTPDGAQPLRDCGGHSASQGVCQTLRPWPFPQQAERPRDPESSWEHAWLGKKQTNKKQKETRTLKTSLVAQWLWLRAPRAASMGSVPGRERPCVPCGVEWRWGARPRTQLVSSCLL